MAIQEDLDPFAGTFWEESGCGRRITSPAAGLHTVGSASQTTAGGGQLIPLDLKRAGETPASSTFGRTLPVLGFPPLPDRDPTDAPLVASEAQLVVDLSEDWPAWSLLRRTLKRTTDIVGALFGLVLLLPVLLVICIAIRLDSSGPVLYRQRRCGRGGRDFQMIKFRSMVSDADQLVVDLRDINEADGLLFKIRNDPRVTRVGSFIRRYSLDELPQLLNVLKGDMSLVGPRPLPVTAEEFGPVDGQRHAVRPGITCHWQVSGRSDISYGQMVEMDLRYIRESSIWTDFRLLVMTIPTALGGEGAY